MSELRTFNDGCGPAVKDPLERPSERMAGLAKGLAIIEAFAPWRPALTVADAARAAGLSRAAARRCLLTLQELGFLAYDGKHFTPTPRMGRLGKAYSGNAPLPVLAGPHLEAARDALRESVSLAVRDDNWSVFVARADSERIVAAGIRLGVRIPLYCSATGRVLLSGLTDEQVEHYLANEKLEPRTKYTVVDPAELTRLVRAAREEGVARLDQELELGLRAIAIPVTSPQGTVVASMSVSASASQATVDELLQEFLPLLREHAEALGRSL